MTDQPAMTSHPATDPLWYKDAIIYQLHVKAFLDSTNDGIGDFAGLSQKLDYLQELGVNTLWLLPFYPSPLKDDGYDIADYGDVNPAYGTLEDFKIFLEEAHNRGLRVITELVINHTSDQHPWFQRARNAPPGSVERDFYVWSDTDQKYQGTRIIFSDTEVSNWTWDPVAKAYYWHRFFSHQPDLNFDNPKVLEEVIKAMYFWLDMGVDGLRLDAVPYLCERDGTNNENLPETHDIIKKIRAALDSRYADRLLLAEANQWPEDVLAYFGNGDECHMAFHFPLMPRIYMAVAQEDRHPITDIMRQTPDIPETCQWATFLRNHDELTLEMVTDRERDYLWNFYAADRQARINFGIRRRLAPLMENDRRKIELLNGLLMSMPGTPVIYYGDEIGMGDNIYLGDRNGVRTPMQWSPDRNGGFSQADPNRLYLPAIMDPVYGFQSINVEAQRRVQNSLYNWTRNLIGAVKGTKAFGRGSLTFLSPSNRKVMAYIRQHENETILCVANLSRSAQPAEIDLKEFKGRVPVEMLNQSEFPPIGELPYFLTLSPYGFYWFRLTDPSEPHSSIAFLPELTTVVIPKGWESLMGDTAKRTLEKQVLPAFLKTQRWYRAKNDDAAEIRILHAYPIGEEYRLLLLEASVPDEDPHYYVLACGIAWESREEDPLMRYQSCVLSKVRQTNRVGVLYEAFQNEAFVRTLLSAVMDEAGVQSGDSALSFYFNATLPDFDAASAAITFLGAEQTNTSVKVGEDLMVKALRQPQPGINPEEEVSRFLTEVSPFERTPHLLGGMRITGLGKETMTVGLIQQAVRNQGDGWKVTLEYLERFLSDIRLLPANERSGKPEKQHAYYITLAERLGMRTAELHNALMIHTNDQAFAPEPATEDDRTRWLSAARETAREALANLEKVLPQLSAESAGEAETLFARWNELLAQISEILPWDIRTPRIRLHGDYHLGQVMVAENDFYIIDFEGEPTRPLAVRRQKTLPFKDVAGMIRSFDYAAAAAIRQADAAYPEDAGQFRPLLMEWRDSAIQAFLHGYDQTIRLPDDPQTQKHLLRFFLLEKALYEIVYEAQHRPDWVGIPLTGLLNLLDPGRTA